MRKSGVLHALNTEGRGGAAPRGRKRHIPHCTPVAAIQWRLQASLAYGPVSAINTVRPRFAPRLCRRNADSLVPQQLQPRNREAFKTVESGSNCKAGNCTALPEICALSPATTKPENSLRLGLVDADDRLLPCAPIAEAEPQRGAARTSSLIPPALRPKGTGACHLPQTLQAAHACLCSATMEQLVLAQRTARILRNRVETTRRLGTEDVDPDRPTEFASPGLDDGASYTQPIAHSYHTAGPPITRTFISFHSVPIWV